MAVRPAFTVKNNRVISLNFEFEFNPGFSSTQKKKNVKGLHESINKKYPEAKVLEVSTKSDEVIGNMLSAFNLKLDGTYLECVFQASKKYEKAGPFEDLLLVSPKEAKRDVRHHESGKLVSFSYNGKEYPLEPKTVFYDWIYIQAVKQCVSKENIEKIKEYTYFTDIEFNPSKSINCQARTVALIKIMLETYGEIPDVSDFEQFLAFHKTFINGAVI